MAVLVAIGAVTIGLLAAQTVSVMAALDRGSIQQRSTGPLAKRDLLDMKNTGDVGWFPVGYGACEWRNRGREMVVALNGHDFGPAFPARHSDACGTCIRVWTDPVANVHNGTEVTVKIVDKYPGGKRGDINLSAAAFQKFHPLAQGRFRANWAQVPCAGTDANKAGGERLPNRPQACRKHAAKRGEGCPMIAESAGIDIETLKNWNPSMDCEKLRTGQEICISEPDKSIVVAQRRIVVNVGNGARHDGDQLPAILLVLVGAIWFAA